MTFNPDPVKLSAMFDALSLADECIRIMVLDELRATRLPELIAAEETAAADLQEAVAALQKPEAALSELEREIARAEGETREWESQAHSDDISARVAAKAWFAEWNAELITLTGKQDQAERDLAPLRQARDQAKNRLYWAGRERENIELNVSDPKFAYIGHGPDTDCFRWWLTFFSGRTLQFGQRDEPGIESGRLHEKALEYLEFLCARTGYRTDQLSQRDAESIRKYWDDLYSSANQPGPVPSGGDVIAAIHAEGMNSAQVRREQGAMDRTITEDHRKPDPVKQVQRLREVRGFLGVLAGRGA